MFEVEKGTSLLCIVADVIGLFDNQETGNDLELLCNHLEREYAETPDRDSVSPITVQMAKMPSAKATAETAIRAAS